ncbi:fructosamine kinase family protein [Allomuricauda sp. SCSIO 65647]|uniref:fructosamine kinase family protein n=1 Tax=Allomuricauda sp. SCSIO 65647 TaxID=2908843 RepID=UPI001F332BF7|nr:fructosamine kinase family protein [Muricauda sp. SCSIO 65647]UJH67157.1 fructosamine kinase family protein [Muricauda sp. SCSIO 65647]
MKPLLEHLESLLNEPIKKICPVSGGDISTAHKVETAHGLYFVKSSNDPNAFPMYEAEAKGLRQLAATNTIAIPKTHTTGQFEGVSYLVMEFVESKRPSEKDFERLGSKLAELHRTTMPPFFGNDHDNFIGSLPQCNQQHVDWATFYVRERLLPQIKMGWQQNLLSKQQIPSTAKMLDVCQNLFGKVTPSLLHGDLWGGNYLIASNGTPYLIDPAVYAGHSAVDLAMSRLFGGFGTSFYEAYHEVIPPHQNQRQCNDVYQLYYLLVHLNLFGSSYRNSVLVLLKQYF